MQSDDFLVTKPLNQVTTKSRVLAMVKDGMLSFKSYDRKIEYIEKYGDIAVVIGREAVEWSHPVGPAPDSLDVCAGWPADSIFRRREPL